MSHNIIDYPVPPNVLPTNWSPSLPTTKTDKRINQTGNKTQSNKTIPIHRELI